MSILSFRAKTGNCRESKRRSTAAAQNVAVTLSAHYALASAAVFCRFLF